MAQGSTVVTSVQCHEVVWRVVGCGRAGQRGFRVVDGIHIALLGQNRFAIGCDQNRAKRMAAQQHGPTGYIIGAPQVGNDLFMAHRLYSPCEPRCAQPVVCFLYDN
jgi:hypothetical protein